MHRRNGTKQHRRSSARYSHYPPHSNHRRGSASKGRSCRPRESATTERSNRGTKMSEVIPSYLNTDDRQKRSHYKAHPHANLINSLIASELSGTAATVPFLHPPASKHRTLRALELIRCIWYTRDANSSDIPNTASRAMRGLSVPCKSVRAYRLHYTVDKDRVT